MRIAYVTPLRFPDDTASAQRIDGIRLALELAGHSVVIGAGQPTEATPPHVDGQDSAEWIGLGELPPTGWGRGRKAARHLTWGGRTVRWLDRLTPRPDAVFIYVGSTPYLRRLLPWSRRNGIPLVIDAVEWYDAGHLPGGRLGPFSLSNHLAMTRYYPMAGNVIAISSFLEGHYADRGCRVVRIPPLQDVAGTAPCLRPGPADTLRTVYAGVAGRKDLLDTVLGAIMTVNAAGPRPRISLSLAGMTVDELFALPSLRTRATNGLPDWMAAHGRISSAQVRELVSDADFLPLVRPPQRYAQAGFPTKVTESLTLGTPVLGNLTGDLGDHLVDGRNAVVVQGCSSSSVVEGLRRAVALTLEQRTAMRLAARQSAVRAFDYRLYAGALDDFVGGLRRPG